MCGWEINSQKESLMGSDFGKPIFSISSRIENINKLEQSGKCTNLDGRKIGVNGMDVERIQKINALAVDLMRQGLATDREDAVTQAERVFRAQDSEAYQSIRETMQQSKRDAALSHASSEPAVELSPDSVRSILEKNTQFIVKKFKDFEDRIESLERDVKELRLKLTYERLPTARDISPAREGASASVMPSSGPVASHPRSGNYRDQDVSIEKVFYMGAK